MPNQFSSGKHAIAQCDRCGQRFKLKQLKSLTIKTKKVNILVCPECWEPDHPQLRLGMYPVNDPQAVRNPRPETGYFVGGVGIDGGPTGGSRDIQWGWNPVGLNNALGIPNIPNSLVANSAVGQVTIEVNL